MNLVKDRTFYSYIIPTDILPHFRGFVTCCMNPENNTKTLDGMTLMLINQSTYIIYW